MSRLVIASAAAFETRHLVEALRSKGVQLTWIETGVGLTTSSAICSNLRSLVAARHIIFCGTGGVIRSPSTENAAFERPEIFKVEQVSLCPYDVRSNQAYLLTDFDKPLIIDNALKIEAPLCHAVGSLGITKSFEVVDQENTACLTLETIELYAVAKNWANIAQSFTAVLASTNFTGPQAHAQWQKNFKTAALDTADFLISEFERLNLFASHK